MQGLCQKIDPEFLNKLWGQLKLSTFLTKGLKINEREPPGLVKQELNLTAVEGPSKRESFAIDLVADITKLKEGEVICESPGQRRKRLSAGNGCLLFSTVHYVGWSEVHFLALRCRCG